MTILKNPNPKSGAEELHTNSDEIDALLSEVIFKGHYIMSH